jgi:hypothetical protein
MDSLHSMHVLLGSMCFFALVFHVANRLSDRYVKVYRDFSIPEQGDWCSRCVSSSCAAVGIACSNSLLVSAVSTRPSTRW